MQGLEGLQCDKAMELDGIHLLANAEVVVNSIKNNLSLVRWENRKILRDIKVLLESFTFVSPIIFST